MFWIELIIVLAIIFWGVRVGGTFLAMAGGVGMLIMTFVLHVPASDPPITVILIMIAVITAAACMQAAGGLDYLVKTAERILRKHPDMITILAPLVAWLFTFMCGTGHIIYSLLPVINEIAMESGVRPERPIASAVVTSQFAITACPISAATVSFVGFMAASGTVTLPTLLLVAIPATLLGSLAAGAVMLKKGKELSEDPDYLARVAAGLVTDYKLDQTEDKPATPAAKISVALFMAAMVGIVVCGIFPVLRPTFADGNQLGLTTIIQIFMLVAAALMVILCKFKCDDILVQPVFRSGTFAILLAFGLVMLVNTFINDQSSFITENMSVLANEYPWIFIIAVFIVGAMTTSQSSTTMIMIPIGIALNMPANILIAAWMCANANFFIPASSQCVAALGFDSAGTTKIGKYILNHSYMLPGMVCTVVSVIAALLIGAIVL